MRVLANARCIYIEFKLKECFMKEYPNFFKELLINQYGENLSKKIIEGYTEKKTTLRVNTLKDNIENIKLELKNENIDFEEIHFIKNALVINSDKNIREFNFYKNGKIYMQSLSSMLPPIVLNPKENENILDMAAAPRRKNNSNCSYNK